MSNSTVLIVDDEAGFVDTLAKRLGKKGYTVHSAFSGPEGLTRLQEHPEIDVVILDVKMPRMDGIETLNRIRYRWPMVEVVMLSGHATVDQAIEGMQRGAFDFLLKPCELSQLTVKIEAAAKQKWRQEKKIRDAKNQRVAYGRIGEQEHVCKQ